MSAPAHIEIPAKVYETRQRSNKAHSPDSSSSSTYSSSPQTPSSAAATSKAAQKRKVVHDRRPSLLSMLLSFITASSAYGAHPAHTSSVTNRRVM